MASEAAQRGQVRTVKGGRLERAAGIEPASLAWKAKVLPLHNARAALGAYSDQIVSSRWNTCFRATARGSGSDGSYALNSAGLQAPEDWRISTRGNHDATFKARAALEAVKDERTAVLLTAAQGVHPTLIHQGEEWRATSKVGAMPPSRPRSPQKRSETCTPR